MKCGSIHISFHFCCESLNILMKSGDKVFVKLSGESIRTWCFVNYYYCKKLGLCDG